MLGGITMNKLFRLFPFLLLISAICFYPVMSVQADTENNKTEKDLDIRLSSQENLFDISNMKPGDWAPRTLTVQNSGIKDFVYQMQVENSGESMLYNELLLEVKAGNQELYQGKLAAFNSLPERELTSGTKENLDITIRFPEHLGNEFQGLNASFVFSFVAEARDGEIVQTMTTGHVASVSASPPTSGGNLPTTMTNIIKLVLIGALLLVSGIVWRIVRYYRRMRVAP